jgi:hypothetical protein
MIHRIKSRNISMFPLTFKGPRIGLMTAVILAREENILGAGSPPRILEIPI